MTSLLTVRDLSLDGRIAVPELSLGAGELVAVIGPNGGGKTSLLRAIAGIDRTSGTALLDGEDLTGAPPARRPYLATFMPASRDLHWPISVIDVIALGLPVADESRIERMIENFALEDLRNRPVDGLSTGERTRVLLGRALAPDPRLLLLDEPLSNLDPYWVIRLVETLKESVSSGTAALVAVHDLAQLEAFDRVLLVTNGEIVADMAPAEIVASTAFADAFQIEQDRGRWRIRPPADRRSSP